MKRNHPDPGAQYYAGWVDDRLPTLLYRTVLSSRWTMELCAWLTRDVRARLRHDNGLNDGIGIRIRIRNSCLAICRKQ